MSTIAGIRLTEAEVVVLSDLIDGLSDSFLAREGPRMFTGGFKKPGAMRDYMKKMVAGNNAVPKLLVQLLSDGVPLRQLVDAFTANSLVGLLPALAGIHGRDAVRLALLTCDAKETQNLAVKVPEHPSEDRKASARELRSRIHRLIQFDVEDSVTGSPDIDAGQIDDVESDDTVSAEEGIESLARGNEGLETVIGEKDQEISKLRKALKTAELDAKAKRENKLRATISDLKNRIAELDAAVNAKGGELARSGKRIDELLARIRESETAEETRIDTEVERRLRATEYRWLKRAIDLESVSASMKGDLLARADAALEEQAKQDRHSSNRTDLAKRLVLLQDRRARLAEAASEAINPISAVFDLVAEIDAEINKVRKALKMPGKAPGDLLVLKSRFLQRISAKKEADGISRDSALIETLGKEGLLAKTDVQELRQACQSALDRLSARARLEKTLADPKDLRSLLRSDVPAILLIDGHNLLFKLGESDETLIKDGKPVTGAPIELANRLSKILERNPNLETRIYFDGTKEDDTLVAPGVRVIFSGGKGSEKHRADIGMIGMARHHAGNGNGTRLFFVTEDRDLATKITAALTSSIQLPSRELIRALHT